MSKYTIIDDIPYGNHERQRLDMYIPEKVKKDNGVILFIHGGGWHDGDKSIHHKDTKYFSELGYITATMNYRFVSEELSVFDELDDISSALEQIKKTCEDYGYNVEKVILSGGSAGGHLSLMYAYTRVKEAPITPVAVCPYCPPVDFSKPDFLVGISGEFEEWKYSIISKCCGYTVTKGTLMNEAQQSALKRVSPCACVASDCVPTAVFYGRYDELIPSTHTEEFIDLLKKLGVENEVLCYENSGHALDKDPEVAKQSRCIISEYAEKYL